MVHYCCVPKCGGKWHVGRGVRFHAFPKDDRMRRSWKKVLQVQRTPSNSMKVCSKHFVLQDYVTTPSGFKFLRKTAVPSQHLPIRHDGLPVPYHGDGLKNCEAVCLPSTGQLHMLTERTECCKRDLQGRSAPNYVDYCLEAKESKFDGCFTSNPQVSITMSETSASRNLEQPPIVSSKRCIGGEFSFFTGIPKSCFNNLYNLLTRQSLVLPCSHLDAEDQLMLTLCQLKHNFESRLIGFLFRVEQNEVASVFSFWTGIMFKQFKAVKPEIPIGSFIRIGLMGIPCGGHRHVCCREQQKPGQAETSGKLKGLVVIDDDQCCVAFCSKLYPPFTSDKIILQDSDLLKCLAYARTVEAPSSLWVDLQELGVASNALKSAECCCKGTCAAVRQESLKPTLCFSHLQDSYKILSDGIPVHLSILAYEIFFVCVMMANLRMWYGNSAPKSDE